MKNEKINKKIHHTLAPIEISQMSSVELKKNAKGDTEIRVKVHNTDPERAMGAANRIFLTLSKKYK